MVLRRADSAAVGDADDQRALVSAAGSGAQAARVRNQLLHAGQTKSFELNLSDGFQAVNGKANGGSDNGGFRERRIHDALVAELFQQSLRDSEHTAIFSHVLTEDQNTRISFHLLFERQID